MSKQTKEKSVEEVTIKLDKGTIPHLLGAVRLGTMLQIWCSELGQSSCGCYDTHCIRWVKVIDYIETEISTQTGINKQERGWAYDPFIEEIRHWVDEQCIKYEKAVEKYHEEEMKKFIKEQSENNGNSNSTD